MDVEAVGGMGRLKGGELVKVALLSHGRCVFSEFGEVGRYTPKDTRYSHLDV